jgi:hypothetical protein
MGLHTIHLRKAAVKIPQIIDIFSTGTDRSSNDGSCGVFSLGPHVASALAASHIADGGQDRLVFGHHLERLSLVPTFLSMVEVGHDLLTSARQEVGSAPHLPFIVGDYGGHAAGKGRSSSMVLGGLPKSEPPSLKNTNTRLQVFETRVPYQRPVTENPTHS